MKTSLLLALVACKPAPTEPPAEADADTDADSDTDTDTDADSDTDTDTDTDTDSDPLIYPAVDGTWCDASERIGRVRVTRLFSETRVRVQVFDAPAPFAGPAVQTVGGCSYHEFDSSACLAMTCGPGTICGYDATVSGAGCVPVRDIPAGLAVTLSDGTASQVIDTFDTNGIADELVDSALVDQAISIEVAWNGVVVTSPTQSLPASDLSPMSVTLQSGDSCAPGDVTLDWTDPAEGGLMHSRTNNNHHLPQDRFTECFEPTGSGSLVIPGAMMDALSGSTCLEFQAVEHARVASVDVPDGCVELWWEGSQTFGN